MGLFPESSSYLTTPRPPRFTKFLGFWPLALSGMVALLATVAILQYRWTDEASTAAEMQMGAELQSLMMKWHGDLYSEFSAVCVAMQVGADSGARDSWKDYLERYVEWRNSPAHDTLVNVYRNPHLVQDIYIWDTNLGTKPQLFRLNADAKKIESASVPPGLQTLLARLRASSTSMSASLRVWQLVPAEASPEAKAPGSSPIAGWQFDENVPAIVHPIFQRDGRTLSSQTPVDWMVIVLDLNAIQRRILPELTTRYFGGLDGHEYKVAVVANGLKPRAIYSSDPPFGNKALEAADSMMYIFGSPPKGSDDPTRHAGEKNRYPQSKEWHSFSGPVWFPVIEYEHGPDPWLLVLQHRAGPLQDVISRVRAKNLAISAMVLILLAINLGFLTIVGVRAQKFAKLQMDFVASVSHELRTPLTAIFSAGENIKDGVVRDRSSLADYGAIVMAQAHQLMNHVDRILLFASIRSGKDRYNLRPLQVSEILQRVRKGVAAVILEESFVIEERLDPDLPRVLGDLFAVSSCLENLITNAIKYSPTDRRIRISAKLHRMEDGSKQVAIGVEDHGIGISNSEMKSIFEPFYRSPDVIAAQIHGTGLGLALAKHLAEAMGGSLSVTSEPGVGSVFTLYLVAVETPEREFSAVSSPTGRGD